MSDKIISPRTLHSPGGPTPHITKRNAQAQLHHFSHKDATTGVVDPSVTVSVAVPTTNKAGKAGATPVVKDLPTTLDVGDVPGRKIVNFYFEDAQGNVVTDFDPPVELRVKITADDIARKKGQKFKLVFWHDKNQQWREIEDNWVVLHVTNEKFFEDPSVSLGGGNDIVVQLCYWPGDPMIGAGP